MIATIVSVYVWRNPSALARQGAQQRVLDFLEHLVGLIGDSLDDVLSRGPIKSFLAAEVIGNRSEIGAGLISQHARTGTVEAEFTKDGQRRVDQPLTRRFAAILKGFHARAHSALSLER
jgi:hypothetical protein